MSGCEFSHNNKHHYKAIKSQQLGTIGMSSISEKQTEYSRGLKIIEFKFFLTLHFKCYFHTKSSILTAPPGTFRTAQIYKSI